MEKTIFLFRRHADRDRDDFALHYIHNHAPLTRCLLGYTVNLVQSEGGPDAVTEHWLPQAADLLTPDKAYACTEDFQAVVEDDQTLFSGFELYVACKESCPLPGAVPQAPLGAPTPGCKLIWFYPDASAAPPEPCGATRIVDNHIGYKLVPNAAGLERATSDIRLIRMAWGPSVEAFGAAASGAIAAVEHRFIAAPQWK